MPRLPNRLPQRRSRTTWRYVEQQQAGNGEVHANSVASQIPETAV